jgi:hypothetical protein
LDLNKNGRYDPATEPLVRTDANGIALFSNLFPGTYSVLEVFDASVQNPFPIPTGPNPVTFDVPGPNTVPTAVRTASSIASTDVLTGGTGVAAAAVTATSDPLTNGGLVAASQVSTVDSLLVPESAVSSFVNLDALKMASSLPVTTDNLALVDPLLLAAVPTTKPLF